MKNKIIVFIYSIITTLALTIHTITNKENSVFLMALLCIIFYYMYNKFYFKKEKHKYFIMLSALFSLFMVFGYSYKMTDSWDLIFGNWFTFFISIIQFIGYFLLINLSLHKIYFFIEKYKFKDIKFSSKVKNIIRKKPFLTSIIFIILCWLPYIISFYPAILSPDPSFQIKQYMGIKTKYMDYAIMIDDSVTITNHHPVPHTLILGSSVQLGHKLFNSTNIGLFIYSILQIIILSSTLALTIKFMNKIKTPFYLQLGTLIIYALVPVFPFYAMSAVKDVMFSSFIILYLMTLYYLIKNKGKDIYNLKLSIGIIFIMLLVMLIRNNGLYIILLSFPFLFLIEKQNRKKILILLIIPILIYKSYTNILLPHYKITDGSIREALSIPFQQTARYVRDHSKDLTIHEHNIIDKVLDIDDLGDRYKPEISDPVKNKFNKYTTKKELKDYFIVWFKGLIKQPQTYIQATINNYYGYFYPDKTNWYIYNQFDERLNQEEMFNYHYNGLNKSRLYLSMYGESFPFIPLLGLIVNIGLNVWIYMFMGVIILKKKCYKCLVYLLPIYSLILVCIASPVNSYFRYAMPFVFALPLSIAIFIDILKNNDKT